MTTSDFLPSEGELSFGEARGVLRDYLGVIEEALAKLQVELSGEEEARLRAQFPSSPSLGAAMVRIHQKYRRDEVNRAVQFAYRSFIVIVASTLEVQARTFCDALLTHKELSDRWKNLGGSNALDRLNKCAFELGGIVKPAEPWWLAAKSLEQIRDCIVHANGEVAGSRNESNLRALVNQVPGYGIDSEGSIVLDEAIGRHAITVFTHLFFHLYEHAKLPGIPLPTDPTEGL
jgi:hypothetical protein